MKFLINQAVSGGVLRDKTCKHHHIPVTSHCFDLFGCVLCNMLTVHTHFLCCLRLIVAVFAFVLSNPLLSLVVAVI